MEGRELRRSYTQVEFPVSRSKAAELAKQQVRTKRFAMPTNRMKFPTLEIYRPPGQRIMQELRDNGGSAVEEGAASKLNVHAKEFVMIHNQQQLQTSKSTGNILAHHGEGRRVQIGGRGLLANHHRHAVERQPLAQLAQAAHQQAILRSQQSLPLDHIDHSKTKAKEETTKSIIKDPGAKPKEGNELRRSKSLYVSFTSSGNHSSTNNVSSTTNSATTASLAASLADQHLPHDLVQLIARAQGDVSSYTLGDFAQLARSLVQKTDDDRRYAEKLADASIGVMEREPHSTFLEALINSLIYSVEKKMDDPGKWSCHALLAFLSHLYSQMKAIGKFVDTRLRSGPHPSSQVLHLLAQCCICTLKNPNLTQRNEVECLFFVITTIGRELEQESVKLSEELMDSVRDALYFARTTDRIRKTLLQMLELYAAKWQIPAESLSFYQSTTDPPLVK